MYCNLNTIHLNCYLINMVEQLLGKLVASATVSLPSASSPVFEGRKGNGALPVMKRDSSEGLRRKCSSDVTVHKDFCHLICANIRNNKINCHKALLYRVMKHSSMRFF